MWWNSKWNYPFKWPFAMDNQCNRLHGNPANFHWLDSKFPVTILNYSVHMVLGSSFCLICSRQHSSIFCLESMSTVVELCFVFRSFIGKTKVWWHSANLFINLVHFEKTALQIFFRANPSKNWKNFIIIYITKSKTMNQLHYECSFYTT